MVDIGTIPRLGQQAVVSRARGCIGPRVCLRAPTAPHTAPSPPVRYPTQAKSRHVLTRAAQRLTGLVCPVVKRLRSQSVIPFLMSYDCPDYMPRLSDGVCYLIERHVPASLRRYSVDLVSNTFVPWRHARISSSCLQWKHLKSAEVSDVIVIFAHRSSRFLRRSEHAGHFVLM